MQRVDYQIIGGGLIGLSAAYALLKRGASVRVIEAREGVGLETSFANAGMVHASLADPWNGPGIGRQLLGSFFNPKSPMKLRLSSMPQLMGWGTGFLRNSAPKKHWHATHVNYDLAALSINTLAQWRAELSIKDDYQGGGLLKIFRTEKDLKAGRVLTDKLRDLGLEARELMAAEAANIEPALLPIAHKLSGAFYYPNDYKADAYLFCMALEKEIIRLGGIVETASRFQNFIVENSVVIGAQMHRTARFAGVTIIAAGARSYEYLRLLNIKLPVRPVKGYSLTFPNIKGPKIPVVDDSLHAAITPLGGGIRIAGTAEIAGFNAAMPRSRLKPLLGMFGDIYPELAGGLSLDRGEAWHGFRPVSADGIPYIGMAAAGLAVNTGHGHMGWTLSAGSGALLADILLGGAPKIDTNVFALRR